MISRIILVFSIFSLVLFSLQLLWKFTTYSPPLHHITIPHQVNSSKNIELSLALKELEIAHKSFEKVKQRGYAITGFYHTSIWRKKWKDVIKEQLLLLDGKRKFGLHWDSKVWTSLLNASDSLRMNVVGSLESDFSQVKALVNSLSLKYRDKVYMHFNVTVPREKFKNLKQNEKNKFEKRPYISIAEYSTIKSLQDYCVSMKQNNKKALVYYLHSKGTCCFVEKAGTKSFSPVSRWRDLLNTFTVEFPSICTRALLNGFSVCGVEYQAAHYSGNFWWADCDHVATLPKLRNRFDAYALEYFIFRISNDFETSHRFGGTCGFNGFDCNVNLYTHECQRRKYISRLSYLLSQEELRAEHSFEEMKKYRKDKNPFASNMAISKFNDSNALKICKILRERGRIHGTGENSLGSIYQSLETVGSKNFYARNGTHI